MMPFIRALRTVSVFVDHFRFGTATANAPVVINPQALGATNGTQPSPTLPTDVAVVFLLSDSNGRRNPIFLRGVPERVVALEEFVPDGNYTAAVQAWANFLVTNGLFKVRSQLGGAGFKGNVNLLEAATPKGIILSVPLQDTVLSVGTMVRISGVGIPGYNGYKAVVQKLTATNTSNRYLLGGASPINDPDPLGTYTYRTYQQSQDSVASVVFDRVGRRETGRPFGLSRGRRPTLFTLRP
jgi:hypothetical protein